MLPLLSCTIPPNFGWTGRTDKKNIDWFRTGFSGTKDIEVQRSVQKSRPALSFGCVADLHPKGLQRGATRLLKTKKKRMVQNGFFLNKRHRSPASGQPKVLAAWPTFIQKVCSGARHALLKKKDSRASWTLRLPTKNTKVVYIYIYIHVYIHMYIYIYTYICI